MTAISLSLARPRTQRSERIRRRLGWWLQPHVSSGARDRRDVAILLVAVLIAVAPHSGHLPWWSTAFICLLWFWRAWLTITRQPPLGKIAMVPLLITATALVWLQHGSIVGHDAGVNLLVLLIALKLLELRTRRDLNLVVFLTFFVQVTVFLYTQDLLLALLTMCTTLLLFFVLLSINLAETDLTAGRKARLVLKVFAKSTPLILALFLLFPRLSSPLFAFAGYDSASSTGLSDSMSVGSINKLIQSEDIVLNASFDDPDKSPAHNAMYWRGPVLAYFDGRTWTGERRRAPNNIDPTLVEPDLSSAVDYTVILEAGQRNWVMALEVPQIVKNADFQFVLADDLQPLAASHLRKLERYHVHGYMKVRVGPFDQLDDRKRWLQLPPDFNPRTHEFAAELRKEIVDPSDPNPHSRDRELIKAVLNHFHRDGYQYTLSPPTLGHDSIDEFLFQTRLGFCEHYASAFVVLMRELGIPARVVTGYQGGELNEAGHYLTVRQLDAHAWAEVWLAGRGWVREDPTAAVSQVRIEHGETELANQLGLSRFGRPGTFLGWIGTWRMNWEALENLWNQAVLNFTADRQRSLISRMGVAPSWRNLAIVFAVTVTGLLVILAALSLHNREARDPLSQLVAQLRTRLAVAGLNMRASEGLSDLRRRVEPRLRPAHAEEASALLRALEDARYGRPAHELGSAELRRLRSRIRRFRPQLNPHPLPAAATQDGGD
jgi:transglutaminase-like putative cysteine protease